MNIRPELAQKAFASRPRWLWILASAFLLMFVVAAFGVTSYFRFSSDTKAIRDEVIKSSGVDWRKRVGINVGGLTLCVVRVGLTFTHLDVEARAALQSVHTIQVGVYQLPPGAKSSDKKAMLAAADRTVTSHGWSRVVCLLNRQDLVTVYVKDKTTWMNRIKCFVMVCNARQMVMVTVEGNPEPLVQCLLDKPELCGKLQSLARR